MDELGEALAAYLPRARWFADKGSDVLDVHPVRDESVVDGDPGMRLVIAAVTTGARTEYYQLLIGHRTGGLDAHLAQFAIGDAGHYEAVHDPELSSRLIELFGTRTGFELEPGAEVTPGRGRLIAGEQSNSSLVFGSHSILKLFRRLVLGENRDLTLHRALAAAGCPHIAAPLGAVHASVPEGPVVLGMLQRFLADAVDGWDTATASVRDLMAEADLHAAEVGGDFAGEAQRLGAAVAAVHRDLAAALGTGEADRDAVLDAMRGRLEAAAAEVPGLAELAPGAAAVFDAARSGAATLPVQQTHGDLHLGQTLRSTAGWVLIDFEGEPAAEPAQRHEPRSPLADIAGMLRSFDYAAHQPSTLASGDGAAEQHQVSVRAREWAVRNIDAFCTGYAGVLGDPRGQPALLRAFELDKAVYETRYEHGHRPGWLPIPLGAVRRLTGAQ